MRRSLPAGGRDGEGSSRRSPQRPPRQPCHGSRGPMTRSNYDGITGSSTWLQQPRHDDLDTQTATTTWVPLQGARYLRVSSLAVPSEGYLGQSFTTRELSMWSSGLVCISSITCVANMPVLIYSTVNVLQHRLSLVDLVLTWSGDVRQLGVLMIGDDYFRFCIMH